MALPALTRAPIAAGLRRFLARLDMVSAICPNCKILLVEAVQFQQLGQSRQQPVNTAARLGAKAISNSYGAAEFSSETSYENYYIPALPSPSAPAMLAMAWSSQLLRNT